MSLTAKDCQVVVSMSGIGQRFIDVGYTVPKFLIEVEGRPVIAHLCEQYKGANDFIFVCNQEHLDNPVWKLRETLMGLAPNVTIVAIAPHKKGPVYAVAQALDKIDMHRPVMTSYCDFAGVFDLNDFMAWADANKVDAGLPCYRGFHPHNLSGDFYDYVRLDAHGMVDAIQPKKPFTDDRTKEWASNGAYYFGSGAILKQACDDCLSEPSQLANGEYYLSTACEKVARRGGRVLVYEQKFFRQWGTPRDLDADMFHSRVFAGLATATEQPKIDAIIAVPAAGLGQRFVDAGYTTPKPLIPLSGQPMILQSMRTLPSSDDTRFIFRSDMKGVDDIQKTIRAHIPNVQITLIDKVTEGQTISTRLMLENLTQEQRQKPLIVGCADCGVPPIDKTVMDLLAGGADVVPFVAADYPSSKLKPKSYGWVCRDKASGAVTDVLVKAEPPADKRNAIISGIFAFRSVDVFLQLADQQKADDRRVNGEFYVDTLVQMAFEQGMKIVPLDVHYCGWGTPDEFNTFLYYQDMFDALPNHPYKKAKALF